MRTVVPKEAKLIPEEAKLVFKGQIFNVYQWPQEMFDGSVETFEMLKRPDTIKVVAVKDGKIVILEEEQPNHRPFLSLPGGRHDKDDETELEAAKRELLEETGMSFSNWRLISLRQPHAKIDWLVYLFLATGFESQQPQKLDAGEKVEIKLLDLDQIKKLLSDRSARYLPKEVFESCSNLDELINMPEYKNG